MELERGRVVRSLAGHDKGGFFIVLSADASTAVICDGKRRPLERPKTKKQKHLAVTATVLPEDTIQTNRKIRTALNAFQNGQTDL